MLEAVEASQWYFFENWLLKLKFPHLLKRLGTIIQQNIDSSTPQSHLVTTISIWYTLYFHMIAQYTVGEGLPVLILGTILKASQNYILLNSTAVKRNETQLGKKIFYVLRNVF